ncbi:Proteasome subunit beta type 3 [Giardia muris]|uniref:Proteasome subunit beta n=1 Tax=Giardia muris TaxID=5742 RepID=A0A4Z1T915_GIAMU|nr:Proteasome subunit beta type 3 [Giardia muris]|eukprot:TNJ30633.1 Proteasome subunit beta type 3 [Giardia muris]
MGNIWEYNGSALVAVRGRDCVAIAADKRLGCGYQTLTAGREERVFQLAPHCLLGLAGLQTDVLTTYRQYRMKANLYAMQEDRPIRPRALARMISHALYSRRFGPYFITPIIAGFEEDGSPYLASMDSIGCLDDEVDFQLGGTAHDFLLGPCETLIRAEMSEAEILSALETIIRSATNRDAYSGWGAHVVILRRDGSVADIPIATRSD